MTRAAWDGPRCAYELTAAAAEHDDAAARAALDGLDARAAWGVVLALGAQARQAALIASPARAAAIRRQQRLDALAGLRGSPALGSALAALDGQPARPPVPVPPAESLAAAARCLAGITAATMAGAGWTPLAIAATCRRIAAG